jgi:hypothetical protein
MEVLNKIQREELSMLKDCNILFSFEAKLAELKEKMQDIKIIADMERKEL